MNNHIKDACKQYITQELNPEYAIMINGPWGCGKTHLVTELLKESRLQNRSGKIRNKVVKISLYGVTSKDDIETQLFYSTHELLDNEVVKSAGQVINSFLGNSYGIDGKTAMSMCFSNWSKEVKVIIVDDLERSSMPISDIMGYFYNYIIEQGIRIIFIGNEDEIKNTDGELNIEYKRTKEKVIGETYTIQAQVEDAVKVFLLPIRKLDIPIPTKRAVEICLRVVQTLEINNLRTIWQGLVQVQRLVKSVVDSDLIKNKLQTTIEYIDGDNTIDDYLAEILEIYLVLYLQLAKGDFSRNEESLFNSLNKNKNNDLESKSIITDVIGVYRNERCSIKSLIAREALENTDSLKNGSDNFNKSSTRYFRRIPRGFVALQLSDGVGDKIWSDYLFKSKIDKELLIKAIEEDKQWFTPKKDMKSSLFKLISDSLNMEQDEFNLCYSAMMNEFSKGCYKEVGELIHGYSMCLAYEKYSVVEYSSGEIENLFDDILQNIDVRIDPNTDYRTVLTRSSMGYQYHIDMTVGEGKIFVDKIRKLIDDINYDHIKNEFLNEFDSIRDSTEMIKWCSLLYINNYGRNYSRYYNSPLISWIGSVKLFDKLRNLSFDGQIEFFNSLEERYGKKYSNGNFKKEHHPDYKILLDLKDKYEEYIERLGLGHIMNYKYKILLQKLIELVGYCKHSLEGNYE